MSNKQREAMLNALATLEDVFGKHKIDVGVINQLREALAEPEQEPAHVLLARSKENFEKKWGKMWASDWIYQDLQELFFAPQPREWQELSESVVYLMHKECSMEVYRAISAALRAKNGFTV